MAWTGDRVLRLGEPITVFSNGSWDTTYDYTSTLCKLAIGVGLTAVRRAAIQGIRSVDEFTSSPQGQPLVRRRGALAGVPGAGRNAA